MNRLQRTVVTCVVIATSLLLMEAEAIAQVRIIKPPTGNSGAGAVGGLGGVGGLGKIEIRGLSGGLGGLGKIEIRGLSGGVGGLGGTSPGGGGDGYDSNLGSATRAAGSVEDLYSDLYVSEKIYDHGSRTLIIVFHPARRIQTWAIRKELTSLYMDSIDIAVMAAYKVLEATKLETKAELAELNGSLVGWFRWQTKAELSENLESIARHEAELRSLNQRARDEASRVIKSWQPKSNWSRNGRVRTGTGPIFGQLQGTANSGWKMSYN